MKIDENLTSEFVVVCLLACLDSFIFYLLFLKFFGKGGLAMYMPHSCRGEGRSMEPLICTPRGKPLPGNTCGHGSILGDREGEEAARGAVAFLKPAAERNSIC